MSKKTLCPAFILIFMLSNGVSLFQITNEAGADVIHEDKNHPVPTSSANPRYYPISGNEEYDDLEEQMQEVFEELRKLEEMFKKKMNREVLPRIQEEIKRLKEWLEKHEIKEDQPPPQWTNLEPTPWGELIPV